MAKGKKKAWKQRQRIVRPGDGVMVGGEPTDIVIPVMGPTGAGKSTFINTLLGEDRMEVGHDITSCTSKIQYAVIDPIPNYTALVGRRLVIVDTPGFDDTYEDDVEILRRISGWLAASYDDDMKLGGVIYLQSIAEKRMKGATRRNLAMFRRLCGEDALAKVVIGTTNWGEVDLKVGEGREKQLCDKFWKDMAKSGVHRFVKTPESAQLICSVILRKTQERDDGRHLLIQKELVELQQHLRQTGAGKELLEQLISLQKTMAEDNDAERNVVVATKLLQQIKDLHINFSWRFKTFFGLA